MPRAGKNPLLVQLNKELLKPRTSRGWRKQQLHLEVARYRDTGESKWNSRDFSRANGYFL